MEGIQLQRREYRTRSGAVMKEKIIEELKKARSKDLTFSSGRILGSMCTRPHPIAVKAYRMFIETNLGDPGLFPGTKEIEDRVIKMIGSMLHAPESMGGRMTSGGTESNLTALWISKKMSGKREVIVSESAHFSFVKASSLMGLKIKVLPSKNYVADAEMLRKAISRDTACVVGIAGTTNLGLIDPIEEMGEICEKKDVFFHVDAAFGGFVIPFLQEMGYTKKKFDFEVNGVSSISVDPHKMGMSVIPSGILLLRKREWLDVISVESACTHTRKQMSILGTRPGASAAATYAVMKYLGKEGYMDVVKRCMAATAYAEKKLTEEGFELVVKPETNLIGVKVKDAGKIAEKLSAIGWKVGVDEENGFIRIVFMPHVKKRLIGEFVKDFKSVLS